MRTGSRSGKAELQTCLSVPGSTPFTMKRDQPRERPVGGFGRDLFVEDEQQLRVQRLPIAQRAGQRPIAFIRVKHDVIDR